MARGCSWNRVFVTLGATMISFLSLILSLGHLPHIYVVLLLCLFVVESCPLEARHIIGQLMRVMFIKGVFYSATGPASRRTHVRLFSEVLQKAQVGMYVGLVYEHLSQAL